MASYPVNQRGFSSSEEFKELGMTTHRIESLTDCIFAFAMTILVLSITVPSTTNGAVGGGLLTLILAQADKFFNYAASFLLLAVFWLKHHRQFHMITHTDRVSLWISIILLMFIALIPFSASLMNQFPKDPISEVFFGINIFIIGLLFYWNWKHATDGHRLVSKDMSEHRIEIGKRRNLLIPLVALIAIVLAFFIEQWAPLAYILIPILQSMPGFRR